MFEDLGGGLTRLRDVLEFDSPCGPLGWLVDRLVLRAYLRRLLALRATVIKVEAERAGTGARRP